MDTNVSNAASTTAGEVQTPAVLAPGYATSADFAFGFRTDKIRDDEGKVIATGRKHPDVKAVFAVPTFADLIAYLQLGGKEAELLVDAAKAQIEAAARQQINDWREANGLDKNFTTTDFNLNGLTLAAIASMDKKDRAGASISDEDWTAFLDDYTHTMVQLVNYDPGKVKLHVSHYKTQFRRIKNDKAAVQKLLDLLNVWASKTENLGDFTTCYEALDTKGKKYLKADEKDVAGAL
jgi:hypothetical protein